MEMPRVSDEDIKRAVRQRYGALAGSGCCAPLSSSCCGDVGDIPASLSREGPGLPSEVTDLSFGCGDPVSLAELTPGQTVLDLGSGGGIDCFRAARQVGLEGRVIGVDMTPQMVERARRHARDLGLTTVEFLLGEVEFLPVADASVDVVISNCVINLVLDKAQVFREAFRVLRAGGRLSISDVVTRGKLPDALRGALSAWAACIGGATTVEDYVAFLRAAGFEDIQVRTSQGASVRLPMMSAHLTARKPLAS